MFLSLIFTCLSVDAFGGKIKSKKIKTTYLSLPLVPLDNLDAKQLNAFLALKDMTVLEKQLAKETTKSACNIINDKIGKKEPYVNHFYKVIFSDPKPIMVLKTKSGHYFVTPDNGTLTLVAEKLGIAELREIDEAVNRRQNSEQSYTFHGRDVYAYTGARLAAGVITFEQVGDKLDPKIVTLAHQQAKIEKTIT